MDGIEVHGSRKDRSPKTIFLSLEDDIPPAPSCNTLKFTPRAPFRLYFCLLHLFDPFNLNLVLVFCLLTFFMSFSSFFSPPVRKDL